jgi:hypothetical protein
MIEALVANFPLTENETRLAPAPQQLSLAL